MLPMPAQPQTDRGTSPEIDHRTIKMIVGAIAVSLSFLTNYFAHPPLASVSEAYWEGGWSQTIFIGFLFAISSFLFAYNGYSRSEMVLSKVAAVAGLGLTLFPCQCGGHVERVPYVHWISAGAMFLTLAYFCYGFYRRAQAKGHSEAKIRAFIYALCGIAILGAILTILVCHVLSLGGPRLVFFGETTGLVAFGASWLTASRVLPIVTRADERFSPLRDVNPP
jgi:L-asparagine transporter-like permease